LNLANMFFTAADADDVTVKSELVNEGEEDTETWF
jgi:hypothetical protein